MNVNPIIYDALAAGYEHKHEGRWRLYICPNEYLRSGWVFLVFKDGVFVSHGQIEPTQTKAIIDGEQALARRAGKELLAPTNSPPQSEGQRKQ